MLSFHFTVICLPKMAGTDKGSGDRKEATTIGHSFAHFPPQVVSYVGLVRNVARYTGAPDLGL